MKPEPQKEHRWLERLVGEWTYEGEAIMGPDQPPSKCGGTESVRSLEGLWVVCEGRGEMPGGGMASMLMTLGYDPAKKRYVGTFVGCMTNLWVYDGTLDTERNILTLDSEGPSFTGKTQMSKYRDIIELKDDDHRTLRSQILTDDGQWKEFMVANYRRKK